ncbi:MAG: FHA domain-containing protein, partial [Myxococcota bacterium]
MSETQNYKLVIEDDEGRRSVVPVELGEVSIGRHDGSTIRLNERNISRQHARMRRDGDAVTVEDLESYNGVWVNGTRVGQKAQVREGDIIRIGDFQLELRGEGLQRRTEETTQRTMRPETEVTQPQYRMQTSEPANNGATPNKAPVEEPEVPRHEPTAIIRLDHLADVEAARRQGANIAGQKAKILCVSTQYAGQEFEITKTEMVIGRTEDNDIAIDHRSVSRHHAKLLATAGSYKVVDLKSANGTLVNGEEYAQTDL